MKSAMKSPQFITRFLFVVLEMMLPACSSVQELPLDTTERSYIGRRWFVHTPRSTCFLWGYLKTPEQAWPEARAVLMDERAGVSPPDRPPHPAGPPRLGDDHNSEYLVQGRYTGETAYDPNSDLVLPLFAARSFTLLDANSGPLPGIGNPSDNGFVPAREGIHQTPARLRRRQ